MAPLPDAVVRMIEATGELTTEQWRTALDTVTDSYRTGYREAAPAARPGAAVFGQVDKRVLEVLRPRAPVITTIRGGAFASASFLVGSAAHAMLKKGLDDAQREVLTRPLRVAGLPDALFVPIV